MLNERNLQGTKFNRFIKLRSRFNLILSSIIFVVYYTFLLVIGLAPDVLGIRIGNSSISIGLVIGISILFLCVILTGLYSFIANNFFDKELEDALKELEEKNLLKDLDKKGE